MNFQEFEILFLTILVTLKMTFFKFYNAENVNRVIGSALFGFLKIKFSSRYKGIALSEPLYVVLDCSYRTLRFFF